MILYGQAVISYEDRDRDPLKHILDRDILMNQTSDSRSMRPPIVDFVGDERELAPQVRCSHVIAYGRKRIPERGIAVSIELGLTEPELQPVRRVYDVDAVEALHHIIAGSLEEHLVHDCVAIEDLAAYDVQQ